MAKRNTITDGPKSNKTTSKTRSKKKPTNTPKNKKTTEKQLESSKSKENLNTNGFDKNPENINRSGRPKGSLNKSTIFKRIAAMQADLSNESTFVKQINSILPGVLESGKYTIEELMLMRLGYEGVAGKNPVPAIKEFLDRLHGKSVQPVEMSGPDGGAINLETSGLTSDEIQAWRNMSMKVKDTEE